MSIPQFSRFRPSNEDDLTLLTGFVFERAECRSVNCT
jgi:hypothetical protein